MSTLSHAASDAATMLRRNLRHMLRYPSMTLLLVGLPVMILLAFVYIFGGTLAAGLGAAAAGRGAYIDYVTPGIVLIALAGVAQGTAVSIAMDMTEGIVTRFRTMAISRASVLTGHVVGSVIQMLLSTAVLVAVALLIGFRPTASPIEWLAAVGVIAMASLALTWLAVALGMVSKSVETASNLPMFLFVLPFLGSGFVPTESMPTAVRWFAEYQPFTPIMDTLRGLLMGTAIGNSGVIGVVWCVGLALVGYIWARRLYDREPTSRRVFAHMGSA
jgi:ABC-2 type transport system permease protein